MCLMFVSGVCLICLYCHPGPATVELWHHTIAAIFAIQKHLPASEDEASVACAVLLETNSEATSYNFVGLNDITEILSERSKRFSMIPATTA